MKPLFASLRDPIYAASAGSLLAIAITVGVITTSAAKNNAAAGPGTPAAASSTPIPTPEPSYADVLADTQRLLDLAEIRDALTLFKQRNGSYPSTQGGFFTLCTKAFDAGCQLLAVAPNLPVTDGDHAYWFQSDGKGYTVFAFVATAPETGACQHDPPDALMGNPVACVSGGQ